jgi:hypothetical protein
MEEERSAQFWEAALLLVMAGWVIVMMALTGIGAVR